MADETATRQAVLSLSLDSDRLLLESFQSVERLSEPYTITVQGVSALAEIDFLPHLGKPAAITVSRTTDGEVIRYFQGLVTEATFIEHGSEGYRYRLVLRPWLYLLGQNRNFRIFQNVSAVDVIRSVFDAGGWSDADFSKLGGAYSTREYCVQYRESDLDFVSRLMEEEGIYYYFEHNEADHTLVLCDSLGSHSTAENYEVVPYNPPDSGTLGQDQIWSWNESVSTTAQKTVTLRNFDFKRPDAPQQGVYDADNQHPLDQAEVYDVPAKFLESDQGAKLGQTILESGRAHRRTYSGETDAAGFACGKLFAMTRHDTARFNQQYLLTGLVYSLEAEQFRSAGGHGFGDAVLVEAVPSSTPYRAPIHVSKPLARGPETALVIGPKDEQDQQGIYTDEYGRVMVRFHWDRRNITDPGDLSYVDPGQCTCWIRVSFSWAGPSMGEVFLPRVGHEVIIDFVDGDPDRPLVTGRVYNAKKTIPNSLPDKKTVSGWKTQTVYGKSTQDYDGAVNPPTDEPGFNVIAFDDQSGQEEVIVRAQRDMGVNVFRDEVHKVHRDATRTIGRNLSLTVQTGDEARLVQQGSRATTIHKDEKLTVEQGAMETTVSTGDQKNTVSKGNQSNEVSRGDVSVKVDMGNMNTDVGMGNYSLKTDLGSVSIEALQQIELKVGQSSIVISQLGVQIKGAMTLDMEGLMTTMKGNALNQITGAIVMIN